MKSKDLRKERIRELKTAIKEAQDELVVLTAAAVEKDKEKDQRDNIMIKKTLIQNMQIELKNLRQNKLSSTFFEFIPSGPNRSQARHFRRNRYARNTAAVQ